MSSVLQTDELKVLEDALTRFVLTFESTSTDKLKVRMLHKMERCHDTALNNALKSSRKATAYGMVANSLMQREWQEEADKWRQIAAKVLDVVHLVCDDRKGQNLSA